MFHLNNYPFLRIVIPFICGILLSDSLYFNLNYKVNINFILLTNIIFLLILLFLFNIKIKVYKKYKIRYLFGLLLTLNFIFLGILIYSINHSSFYKNYLANNVFKRNTLLISELNSSHKEKRNIFILNSKYIVKNGKFKPVKGKLICFISDSTVKMDIGDIIAINTEKIQVLKSPNNPGQFDYRRYLFHSKDITFNVFLNRNDFFIIKNKKKQFYLDKYAHLVRNYLTLQLHKVPFDDNEFSVASAILLGKKENLNREIKNQYADAGAMHILAVSGLHVGIIFLILDKLLFFIKNKSRYKYFKLIFILLGIWIYAFITGFSPSVLRASFMFSFLICGQYFNRYTNIYNTLAASAFLMLLFSPDLLFNIGFQLSYLAVLGIFLTYNFFYQFLYSRNFILNKIGQVLALSLSAQLFTFPLSIYYFHRFPVYFLITNIIVVYSIVFVLVSGFLYFFTVKITYISPIFSYFLKYSIYIQNKFVEFVNNIPYSVADNLSISQINVVCLYIIIFTISFYFLSKKIKFLKISLMFINIFLIISIISLEFKRNKGKFIVLDIPQTTAFLFLNNNSQYVFTSNQEKIKDYLKNISLNFGIDKTFFLNKKFTDNIIKSYRNFYKFFNIIIFKPEGKIEFKKEKNNFYIDYVVLTNKTDMYIEWLKKIDLKQVIIDSSVNYKKRQKIIRFCKTNKIPFWDIYKNGAFVYDLSPL